MTTERPIFGSITQFKNELEEWLHEKNMCNEELFPAFIFQYKEPSKYSNKFIFTEKLWNHVERNRYSFDNIIKELAKKNNFEVKILRSKRSMEIFFRR